MTWTYAPAPESAALANLQPTYRPFIEGEVRRRQRLDEDVNPATEEVLAEVGTASSDDVDRAVAAARRAYETTWGPMPGAERAKYLFRIARIVAERARELAVLETLDNGKPIRESRDVDVPRPRRTCSTTRAGPTSWSTPGSGHTEAVGRGRRGDPVELPVADGRVEGGPALATRQHDRAQARRDHPAHRVGARRDRRRGRAARGRAQRAARRGRRRRRAWWPTPAWRRWRSPAPPTSASRSSARSRAPASGSRWSWAARRPTSCTPTRRWTRPSRASSRGSSSTRATCAARAPGCSCRSRSPRS